MLTTNVPVDQFTTFHPVTAKADMDMDELRDLMAIHGIRHLPVFDGSKLAGVISERDIRLVSGLTVAEKLQVRADDLMTVDPLVVDAKTPLEDVVRMMVEKKIGSAIVKDQDDGLLGIFTATDALNVLIQLIGKLPRSLAL
ncbi:MAG: CBS domain-containing protein [Burkholderiaceae bacterium]|nr:MAG: CBS domain-containing protein [Burkholderiaceae bacterium]